MEQWYLYIPLLPSENYYNLYYWNECGAMCAFVCVCVRECFLSFFVQTKMQTNYFIILHRWLSFTIFSSWNIQQFQCMQAINATQREMHLCIEQIAQNKINYDLNWDSNAICKNKQSLDLFAAVLKSQPFIFHWIIECTTPQNTHITIYWVRHS